MQNAPISCGKSSEDYHVLWRISYLPSTACELADKFPSLEPDGNLAWSGQPGLGPKSFLCQGERGVGTKVAALHRILIAGDRGLQYRAPTVGAADVARAQRASLQIAELDEADST